MKYFLIIVMQFIVLKAFSSEPETLYLNNYEKPDQVFFQKVLEQLNLFRDERPYKSEWEVKVDETKGVIETNWFPEHKGEVRLKIQIVVWGVMYRIDVLQQEGLIFKETKKTSLSLRFERDLQNAIGLNTGR